MIASADKESTATKASSGTASGKKAVRGGSDLRAAQQSLNDQGYDSGKVDGVLGPKTAAALRKFQGEHGLKATGKLDSQTTAALGIKQPAGSMTTGSAETAEKTAAAKSGSAQ